MVYKSISEAEFIERAKQLIPGFRLEDDYLNAHVEASDVVNNSNVNTSNDLDSLKRTLDSIALGMRSGISRNDVGDYLPYYATKFSEGHNADFWIVDDIIVCFIYVGYDWGYPFGTCYAIQACQNGSLIYSRYETYK